MAELNTDNKNIQSAVKIGKKTFISSVLITFSLMIISGILTYVIPSGMYDRIMEDGRETIVANSFHYIAKAPLPVYRWFTAPIEVLFSSDGLTAIMLVLLIISIGGGFEVLDKVGVFKEIISKVIRKFNGKKYLLICAVTLVFMGFGAILGMFEEVVTMIPIAVALSYTLGWDALMGLGMSLLAICFGFTVAISNPYTIGLAQRLGSIPMFSGTPFRILLFLIVYAILCVFLTRYAKKIDANPKYSTVYEDDRDVKEKYSSSLNNIINSTEVKFSKPTKVFLGCISVILAVILLAAFVPAISNYSMPIIALVYLISGIWAGYAAGSKTKEVFKMFGNGVSGIAPGIILLLLALSVSYIIKGGHIIDTIVYNASILISRTPPVICGYLIYALVLLIELFIGSASAKAFLLMPIIMPLSDIVGLTRQTAILAYCFGDGFSNIIYPTNPVLLISLGLTTVSYPKWFKWTIKLQLFVLALTCLFIAGAVAIGYK
jgi:Predicted membrane protein